MRAFGFLWLAIPTPGLAADLTVCGDVPEFGCYPTVGDAVAAALDGDAVVIPEGFFAESLVLIDRELTLRAEVAGGLSGLYGDGTAAPILRVIGGDLTLSGLLLGGPDGRALEISDGATVRIDGSRLSATALQTQGGIASVLDSRLEVTSSYLTGGRALRSGGQIYARDSELVVRSSFFTGGTSMTSGGSILSYHPVSGSLEVEDSSFVDNTATASAGAAISVGGVAGDHAEVPVTLRGSTFERNTSTSEGVIHGHYSTGPFVVEQCVFSGNRSASGSSTLVLHDTHTVTVRRTSFCGNGPSVAANGDGVLSVYAATSLDVRNSLFLDNAQTSIATARAVPTLTVQNNHFVGNIAPFQPIVDAGFEVGVTFTDNLVAWNRGTSAIARGLTVEEAAALVLDHNLWWENDPADVYELGADEVRADPRLDGYQPGGPCPYIDEDQANQRDAQWPSWYGASRDAGSDRDVDLDGTALDIGAFGGSEARAVPDWDDADGDGVPTLFDCNRFDRTIASGLTDEPYDNIDVDCRGDDDFDGDDDGYRPSAWALPGQPVDCDDTDARRFPGQPEIASNGIDDDCDGWADNTGALTSGSCATAPASLGWALILVAAAVRRRSLVTPKPRSRRLDGSGRPGGSAG